MKYCAINKNNWDLNLVQLPKETLIQDNIKEGNMSKNNMGKKNLRQKLLGRIMRRLLQHGSIDTTL